MGNDAALTDEAPLTLRSLPFWALFIVIFAVVTVVGGMLLAATTLLSTLSVPSVVRAIRDRDPARGRMRPARHLSALPSARL